MTTKENCVTAGKLLALHDLLADKAPNIMEMTPEEYAGYLLEVGEMENLAIKLDGFVGKFQCNPFDGVSCPNYECLCFDHPSRVN